ncbi:hypothetical protein COV81_00885 [Candidatus Peregrinibacteria bacterium CG11_big_fil_rev_8_21_14_0_20_41_10]|nr:MAG: hypothetical protein COV81_00885 [Candidatus Peregrinibacteria bacterium CG11_big_fil_rev_8_21_14_0_20_41_10]PIZ76469.1 MAG: hypothetical protein COY06_01890 [Candidatus Peregrinibacteria bacterium CG_4_10_14_0_2_um_filter_41_8]
MLNSLQLLLYNINLTRDMAKLSASAIPTTGDIYDFDGLMNKLMLMRAINRPSLSDVMVAPIGQAWDGTKPNGIGWTITKVDDNKCNLSVAN